MWLKVEGKDESLTVGDVVDDPAVLAQIQGAVDEANKAVSNAEAIKKFVIVADEWTEEGGQLTPSMKLKRNVVMKDYEAQIEGIYA
jgi:long-chain acyl-CoA synthetase